MTIPLTGPQRATTTVRARGQIRWRKMILPWLFLAPILVLNVVVILGPSVGSAVYAFTSWSGVGPAQFVGLANFQRMLGDRIFRLAFINNVKWTIIFMIVPVSM